MPNHGQAVDIERHQPSFVEFGCDRVRGNERNTQAGNHGLMVSRGMQRGVLLPQVAAQFRWSGQRLLEETCVKAGFERDAWKNPEIVVQAFTAEIFSESDLSGEASAESETPGRAKPDYSSST